jgi:hypothetical protein
VRNAVVLLCELRSHRHPHIVMNQLIAKSWQPGSSEGMKAPNEWGDNHERRRVS